MIDQSVLLAYVVDTIEQSLEMESDIEGQEIRVYQICNRAGSQGHWATYAKAEVIKQWKCRKLSLSEMLNTTQMLGMRRNVRRRWNMDRVGAFDDVAG